MNINELVQKAKLSAPELRGLAEEDARSLLQSVFRQIREEIDLNHEGLVKVAHLGQFRIRQGEREQDGRKVPVKRIGFRPAKPKTEM